MTDREREKAEHRAKYAAQIEQFKAFVLTTVKATEDSETDVTRWDWDDRDFYDLSIGFFCALGVPHSDAFSLALITRYDLQYWESEW